MRPRNGTGVRRDPVRTKSQILEAAIAEFAGEGLSGARIARIARRAGTNVRMIYHYFGNKEDLYVAVLDAVYQNIRGEERRLNLQALDPVTGMERLIDFTFTYFAEHPEFISLLNNENLHGGRYLARSDLVPNLTPTLDTAMRDLLARGEVSGVFRSGVDPVQLYVSMVSLSYLHRSNLHTLSAMYRKDLDDPAWLEARRVHMHDMVMGYLLAQDSSSASHSCPASRPAAPPH